MKYLTRIHDKLNSLSLEIGIDILTFCNNRCSYCYNGHFLSNPRFMAEKVLGKIISKIEEYNKPVEISLLGGEPTLHPKLKEIVKRFVKLKNVEGIEVYTNGRRDLEKIKLFNSLPKDIGIVSFTIHSEYVKYIDDIIKNILNVRSRGFRYRVSVMYHPYFKDAIQIIRKKLKENNISYKFDYIRSFRDDERVYELDSPKEFTLNGEDYSMEDLMNNHLNRFKGWNCILGEIGINVEGMVSHACRAKKYISVFDEKFKLEKSIVKCPYEECADECRLSQQKFLEEE